MKIAHITDHYQPWLGYQETYLPLEQKRQGHDVCVITSDRYTRDAGSISGSRITDVGLKEELGVKVYRLPVYFETPTNASYVFMRGLSNALVKFSPNVVHCHGFLSITSFQAAYYRNRLGYKLLLDNHNSFYNLYKPNTNWYQKQTKNFIYRLNAATYGQYILANANSIVAIGEPEKDFLKWVFGKSCPDIPIIRLGADTERFRFDPVERRRIREAFEWIGEDLIVLGHAGTLRPSKRFDLLLRACAGLSNYRDSLRFILIGSISSSYQTELNKLADELGFANQLIFTGHISIEDLPNYLNALDIAVWPGDISVTAIEAMSVGLPVVAVRTPYTEQIIENHQAGLLFTGGNSHDLMSSIEMLIREPSLRLDMSNNALKAVNDELNWQSIAVQFLELYGRM